MDTLRTVWETFFDAAAMRAALPDMLRIGLRSLGLETWSWRSREGRFRPSAEHRFAWIEGRGWGPEESLPGPATAAIG